MLQIHATSQPPRGSCQVPLCFHLYASNFLGVAAVSLAVDEVMQMTSFAISTMPAGAMKWTGVREGREGGVPIISASSFLSAAVAGKEGTKNRVCSGAAASD